MPLVPHPFPQPERGHDLRQFQRDRWLGAYMEPRYTIYGASWDAARASVAALPSPDAQAAYGALLDHLEWGWIMVRRLQGVAEFLTAPTTHYRAIDLCLGEFVLDMTARYGQLAFTCRDRLPAEGRPGTVAAYDAVGEAKAVYRAIKVLSLARESPQMHDMLHGEVRELPFPFKDWVEALPGVLAPVEALEEPPRE